MGCLNCVCMHINTQCDDTLLCVDCLENLVRNTEAIDSEGCPRCECLPVDSASVPVPPTGIYRDTMDDATFILKIV